MADQSRPIKGVAFDLDFCLYGNNGEVVMSPGTFTSILSLDDSNPASSTNHPTVKGYGKCRLHLTEYEMNHDSVWVYITDSGVATVPFTLTIYPAESTGETNEVVAAIDARLSAEHGDGSWGTSSTLESVFITQDTPDTTGLRLGETTTNGVTPHVMVFVRLASDITNSGTIYSGESDADGKFAVEVPVGQAYSVTFVYPDWTFNSRLVVV